MTGQGRPGWGEHWQDEILAAAARRLPPEVNRHYLQGARDGVSAAEAHSGWSQVRFVPRVLRAQPEPDLRCQLLGRALSAPIGIAPTSLKGYADPEGDVAMARAARTAGSLLVVPSNTAETFEEIGATGAHWWLQLYLTQDRALVLPLVRDARAAGASALVLTVDTPVVGTKYGGIDPRHDAGERVNHGPRSRHRGLRGAEHATDLGPEDIGWLAETFGLPVVVKGVMDPRDAQVAADAGAAAVWVSNHGGRQLDRAATTASVLPRIAAAVGERVPVVVDGGVHNGLDTLAALGLGADAVFLGRLPLMALAAAGESGVVECMDRLRDELSEALMLAGCSTHIESRTLLLAKAQGGRVGHETRSDLHE